MENALNKDTKKLKHIGFHLCSRIEKAFIMASKLQRKMFLDVSKFMIKKFGEAENDSLFYLSGAFQSSTTTLKRNIKIKQMFTVLSEKRKHVPEFMAKKSGEIKNDYLYSF